MSIDIKGALEKGRLLLKENGIEQARLDAEILLAHILGKERSFLYREPECRLGSSDYKLFMDKIKGRAKKEPVAYLTGKKEFMGLDFKVDSRVLVPRPETEMLAEAALVLLGGPLPPEGTSISLPPAPATGVVADVGTGSGALGVSLAYYMPGLFVLATDISHEALELARENACRLGVEQRVNFLQGDLLEPLDNFFQDKQPSISLLTANLPYVPTGEMDTLPGDVRLYEPQGALDGGNDGLYYYRRLMPLARKYLAPGGYFLMEIAPGQGEKIKKTTPANCHVKIYKDPGGRERLAFLRLAP